MNTPTYITPAMSEIGRTNQFYVEPTAEVAKKLQNWLKDTHGLVIRKKDIQDISKLDPPDRYATKEEKDEYYQERSKEIHRYVSQQVAKILGATEVNDPNHLNYGIAREGRNGRFKEYVYYTTPAERGDVPDISDIFTKHAGARQAIVEMCLRLVLLGDIESFGLSKLDRMNATGRLYLVYNAKTNEKNGSVTYRGYTIEVHWNEHNIMSVSPKRSHYTASNSKTETESGAKHRSKSWLSSEGDIHVMIPFGEPKKTKGGWHTKLKKEDGRNQEEEKELRFKKASESKMLYRLAIARAVDYLLSESGIPYEWLDFQANGYIGGTEKTSPFIEGLPVKIPHLEIINNFGKDFTESEKSILTDFFQSEDVSEVSFYADGKAVAEYTKSEEEKGKWAIKEKIPWDSITLSTDRIYLVFNKSLRWDGGGGVSLATRKGDVLLSTTSPTDLYKVSSENKDFYSRLKDKYDNLKQPLFYGYQGMNISYNASSIISVDCLLHTEVGKWRDTILMSRPEYKRADKDTKKQLRNQARDEYNGADDDGKDRLRRQYIRGNVEMIREHYPRWGIPDDIDDGFACILWRLIIAAKTEKKATKLLLVDKEKRGKPSKSNNLVNISEPFRKVVTTELKTKQMVMEAVNNQAPIPLSHDRLVGIIPPGYEFFTTYTRYKRGNDWPEVVGLHMRYEDNALYVIDVITDLDDFEYMFPFHNRSIPKHDDDNGRLLNDQHFLADLNSGIAIAPSFVHDKFTPILLAKDKFWDDTINGKYDTSRSRDTLRDYYGPMFSFNEDVTSVWKNITLLIMIDSKDGDKGFIQYYVPDKDSYGPDWTVNAGYRVYHMFGYGGDDWDKIPASEFLASPLAALHFYTLTNDLLKLGDKSKMSLLEKIAQVFIEN